MYADTETASIRACLDVTRRRRRSGTLQRGARDHAREHQIGDPQYPRSVYEADYVTVQTVSEEQAAYSSEKELPS